MVAMGNKVVYYYRYYKGLTKKDEKHTIIDKMKGKKWNRKHK